MYLDQFILKYPKYKTSAVYKCLCSELLNAQSNNKDKFDGNYYNSTAYYFSLIVGVFYLGKILPESLATTSNILDDLLDILQIDKISFEKYFRNQAKGYHHRYCGHYNISTDNKEANFFGR